MNGYDNNQVSYGQQESYGTPMHTVAPVKKSKPPTPEQQKVIDSRDRYILVSACAGSGKTQTLVERCSALPSGESKIVLAFNKKAAEEFSKRVQGQAARTEVKTFHSFCLQQIRANPSGFGYSKNPKLDTDTGLFKFMNEANSTDYSSWEESPWDQEYISSAQHSMYDFELMERLQDKPVIGWDELKQIKIDWLKEQKMFEYLVDGIIHDPDHEIDWPEDLLELEDKLREFDSARGLLHMREFLQRNNILTFDEMIRIVAENRNYLTKAADHVMVDEFQDVDKFQFDIVAEIGASEEVKSLTAVGDLRQLIYGWRGALRDSFEAFRAALDGTTVFDLTVNFRSFDGIINEANKVFGGMRGVRGEKEHTVVNLGDMKKNDFLAEFLEGVHSSELHELAVLCRYNRQVAMWNINLAKKGIPVNVIGKGDFWNMKHVKLAEVSRRKKLTLAQLAESEEWTKLMKDKRFRRNEEAKKEALEDAKFVLEMDETDYITMRKTMSNEKGIRLSTIHKTKGLEFRRVMLPGVDEKLKEEECLYYVALTRAKDRLIFG